MHDEPIRALTAFLALLAASALTACSRQADPPRGTATSPQAPVSQEADVQPFALGNFSAIALRDGGLAVPNDNKVFGVGRTPEDVAAVLRAAGQSGDELQLSIQPLLVRAGNRVLLFDTGTGAKGAPAGGRLASSLAAAQVAPEDITDIFISHAHFDHVGGLVNDAGGLAFPNAAVHLSAPEWAFLQGMTAETAARYGFDHDALIAAMSPKVEAFAPGAEIIPGVVTAVEIRGHTPGHSGYLIGSGASSLLYVGDAVHHFVVSVQRPEWTIAFDTDARTAETSRAELLARSAASGQRIYAVHFPFPGLGRIERRGEGFVWVGER